MPLVLNATPGDPAANSYETVAEALSYLEGRVTVQAWEDADSQEMLLVMATRLLDVVLTPFRRFVPASGGTAAYYITRRAWTGTPTTSTQALAWPRTGMFNRNGFAISTNVIPKELKEATSELAIALAKSDLTQDNDITVQGISSIKAGPVSLSWEKSSNVGEATTRMLPDMVLFSLVPSWLSQEVIEYVQGAFVQLL